DELEAYGADLIDKPVIVALNKIDTLDDELIAALSAELAEESGHPVMALSGVSGAGVEAVLDKLLEAIGTPEPGADPDDSEVTGDWSPI
ncbi:MAG TPA: FeoB small GTPase domain-containing protein, partial [Sphingopyxis sp.]|nr:FeoB small GTPase domain-containing protein [Sphingopyxis sp.]